MTTIPSLKQLIASNGISQRKVKEFGLVQSDIDRFTDVAQMPNAATYTTIPNLVAKDGTIYTFSNGGSTTSNHIHSDLLTSHPGSEASQFSEIADSTLQTSQELILSDNNI
ncbi:hypothetical protein CORT_0A13170 [Candida orthopsilosis Co 90-125]|uniref:Uncharacterized protein n=1 Tax=Candida orthopsilosis (strain 90-125) TaxID=1136231 RepID=H8WXM7_CANO9|nr:hypothetical protein CORT_0A13170 [Candida orthopsilosis Co 90-125]CCG21700.1 hypothetical protein CORT_0A13170 [Candida orthopsilosis Co 90-125]